MARKSKRVHEIPLDEARPFDNPTSIGPKKILIEFDPSRYIDYAAGRIAGGPTFLGEYAGKDDENYFYRSLPDKSEKQLIAALNANTSFRRKVRRYDHSIFTPWKDS